MILLPYAFKNMLSGTELAVVVNEVYYCVALKWVKASFSVDTSMTWTL
jgi:hypothetical protein